MKRSSVALGPQGHVDLEDVAVVAPKRKVGVIQPVPPTFQQRSRALDGTAQSREVVSPYLTSREALAYLRLGSLGCLYSHIRNNNLPVCRSGRHMRFDVRELDKWMRGEWTADARSKSA